MAKKRNTRKASLNPIQATRATLIRYFLGNLQEMDRTMTRLLQLGDQTTDSSRKRIE